MCPVPPCRQIAQSIEWSTDGHYYPIIFMNEFWLLRDKNVAMNDTVTEVELHLEVRVAHASAC